MKKMTVVSIRQQIKEINVADDESAHCDEDQLYYDFVEFIARTAPDPYKTLAAEVKKVRDLNFARWHA